jgi:MFS family permease
MLCLAIMAAGMYAAAIAENLTQLSIYRLITGLGIGGMLAAVSAVAAEFSNQKWRGTAVSLVAAGFPLGMIIGGAISAVLLKTGTWRDVFLAGAIATSLALPLVYFIVPETLAFLLQQRKSDNLGKVNKTLLAIGLPAASGLPDERSSAPIEKVGWFALFDKATMPITLLLTSSFFLHMISSYFVVKWMPAIVTNLGFSAPEGAGVLVWASIGGLLGALTFSFISFRLNMNALLLAALLLAGISTASIGIVPRDLFVLSTAAGAAVFFANAAVVGLYALMATSFPTRLRASGIGFVIGIGRGGAAVGPVAGGLLFSAGFQLDTVMSVMAIGSILATGILAALLLRGKTRDEALL